MANLNNKLGGAGQPPSRDVQNQRKILHKSLNTVTPSQANSRSPEQDFHISKPFSSQGNNMSVQMMQ